jgi:ureidoglycolate lyase
MERHAHSSQAFVPLDVAAYVVIVVPDIDDAPDAANAIGFIVPSGTGISYRAGVWHTGMMVLDQPAALVILVHEDGTSEDCHFRAVEPFRIDR